MQRRFFEFYTIYTRFIILYIGIIITLSLLFRVKIILKGVHKFIYYIYSKISS